MRKLPILFASVVGLLMAESVGSAPVLAAIPPEACYACLWEVCGAAGNSHWDDTERSGTKKGGTTHSSCSSGDCSGHQACGGEEFDAAEMSNLLIAYDKGDAAALARLVLEHRGIVEFNRARSVLQVEGCNGVLRASLPIELETAETIEVALRLDNER